ncbi:RNase P subunit [Candidatus Nitrosopelagicus sp.]|uniref:Ribonuclease P protein component 4 n=1 Tax=uncultured marine thaumarchaeote KM3_24_H04 TaxID=1456101 RepID=A0A075GXU6_9ARCH|nr:RNase P subunit (RPR2, RPP21) [uncultured marine thaumarchaeote KM3_24_H04]MDC0193564.1 RNase P subunit [Candidatus Nitrosopelagicus sp.]
MKKAKKEIATKRMHMLFKNAISNARTDANLAERQAITAKKISMKYKIRMPYEIRSCFCKKCKKFIVPGINSKIRVGRSNVKSIRITCNFCTHTYRKIIKN